MIEGEVLSNRYEIRERIGEGGMAVVYKAKDKLLHRWVAVKVLREQYASDEDFVERFRREAQAAASLSHPNVVNIYDVGEIGNTHYIVMEYVPGINLKELIRREGKLSPERSVSIAIQVAAALGHAHRKHLVHRDIKPHNILITPEGNVKVTDFGIARAMSTATLTQTGQVIGSVHYFSPEQARGGVTSEQSDIYSLGIVLYEMLTGKVPFTGETPIAVALQQLQDPVPSPREIDPTIPKSLDSVILKALAKDPKNRFRSAEEFIRALQDTNLAAPFTAARTNNGELGDVQDAWEATRMMPVAEPQEATRIHGLEERRKVSRGKRSRPPKKRRIRALIFLFLVAFLGGLFWAISYLPELIFPAEVTVPDVTGLTVAEARLALEKLGLRLAVDREIESDVPAGRVLRQDPAANRRVREGRTVWVVVSRGPRLVQVPSVVGLSLEEAKKMIVDSGLTVGVETAVYEPTVLEGYVVSQSPQGGTYLEEGLAVDLMVSRTDAGLPMVVVPDLRGQLLDDAKIRVRRLGLTIGNVWGRSDPSLAPWEVISQSPAPGTQVPQDTPIDFVYNSWSTGQAAEEPPADFEGASRGEERPGEDVGGEVQTGSAAQERPIDTTRNRPREAAVQVTVPPGPEQEVVIIVIDALGAREVYRGIHPGESSITRHVRGYGSNARIQVYVDNTKISETEFPD